MEKSENLQLRGDIEIIVRKRDSRELVDRIEVRNKIVAGGMLKLGQMLVPGATATPLAFLKVGTGTTRPASNDTSLQAPVLVDGSVTLLASNVLAQSTATGARVVVTASLPTTIASGLSLSEAGLFLSGNTLLARQIHVPVTTDASLSYDYTWTLTFTA